MGSPSLHFDAKHYVPILKCKLGETHAIKMLSSHATAQITPLVELVCESYDEVIDDEPVSLIRTWREQIPRSMARLRVIAARVSHVFVDPFELGAEPGAATAAFAAAAATGISFLPVIRIDRPEQEQAGLAVRTDALCLRLTREDLERRSNLTMDIEDLLQRIDRKPEFLHLVLDLGSIYDFVIESVELIAETFLHAIPRISEWRTLTLAASAFPLRIQPNSCTVVERSEWSLWQLLRHEKERLGRLPTFGDYGIQHPAGVEGFQVGKHQVAACIRYLRDDNWLLIKGVGFKASPLKEQFPKLAHMLVNDPDVSPYFYGNFHCTACVDIVRAASGSGKFGSATIWRRLGTAHHITTVVRQLEHLHGA